MNGITDRITATELTGQPDTLTCDGLVIVMTTDQSQGWGYNLYNELWHWLSAQLIWELCPGVGTISISVIMRSEPQALLLTKVSVPCPNASWCDHDHPMLKMIPETYCFPPLFLALSPSLRRHQEMSLMTSSWLLYTLCTLSVQVYSVPASVLCSLQATPWPQSGSRAQSSASLARRHSAGPLNRSRLQY